MADLLWLPIALLLASAALLLTWGKESDAFGHLIGTLASCAAFVVGVIQFIHLAGTHDRVADQRLFTWIDAGPFHVDMTLRLDSLSAVFVLLITGVGSLIHIYSIGYMAHDERRRRFFAFLNLFVAAMLTLVLAADYLVLFLGWEGVGLASYLLIGFWQHKHSAAEAAKKAFILNRVGDLGMALGIMTMFAQFGTSSIAAVNSSVSASGHGGKVATALGLLLLLAACGKSAQVPLQAWLLDAMEGPTPVSALIHAATMVTAGVYLIVRSNAIYDASETARYAVMAVGLVTLLVGAYIGCAKDDIKKALAGSTMSQIGYMVLAAGLGPAGYAFAIFHLLTHGFFKANMFLGAGSVMHAMDDDVNMRHYGGLAKVLPLTSVTFGLGYLAIIGFPGFAGFFSKDRIIEAAFGENFFVGLGALIGAGVTAFYMTRLMAMTFFGQRRWQPGVHPHESPLVMTLPLVVLGALSAGGGALIAGDWITTWLAPVVGPVPHEELGVPAWVVSGVVTGVVAVGVYIGWRLYAASPVPGETPVNVSFPVRAGRAELFGNDINDAIAVRPTKYLVRILVWVDSRIIDTFVFGLADRLGDTATALRRPQTGFVRSYALGILGGAAVVLLGFLAVTLT